MNHEIISLMTTVLYFVNGQTKILMLDMIIASLKSDMAYLTQAIRQMDDKAKKKVEKLLQTIKQDKLSIPENVRLFINLYYQIHPANQNLYRNR